MPFDWKLILVVRALEGFLIHLSAKVVQWIIAGIFGISFMTWGYLYVPSNLYDAVMLYAVYVITGVVANEVARRVPDNLV